MVHAARHEDPAIGVIVLTGAGDLAFCSGGDQRIRGEKGYVGLDGVPRLNVLDLQKQIRSCPKPVIAMVDGISCGGAFYLLGEVDFVIASDRSTFFDPHVTYNMTAAYEPVQLLQKMPLQEVLRMALLGAHERMSAQRAYEVGLVSEVVAPDELEVTVRWAAEAIASAPPLNVQGTLRAIWMANEVPRSQMLELCALYTRVGTDPVALQEGQATFASKARIQPRIR